MYTQCPECETTFKLGAEDLRLANGKVRCGDCNHVFNALEFLAEEVEEELVTETAEAEAHGWTSSGGNPSGDLEPDLDEYESTAYLDDEEVQEPDAHAEDEAESEPEREPEYHDEDEEDEGPILYIGDDEAGEADPEQPSDENAEVADDDFEVTDVEIDDDVWDQVAGVVIDPENSEPDPDATEDEGSEDEIKVTEFEDEPDDELDDELEDNIGDEPDEEDLNQEALTEEESDEEEPAEEEPVADDLAANAAATSEGEGDDLEFNVPEDKWGNFFGPLPKGQTAAVWQPPQLEADAEEESAEDAWDELTEDTAEPEAETEALADDDAPSWKDAETDTSNTGLYLIGGITLAVLLAMQLVHYNRDRLAANASWGENIRAVYGTFGSKLYPEWSIDDYEIRGSEAVAGETGRDVLDIRAQIANTGTGATGLPRLRIMLKDRWSNPVAAQDFSAAEYATNLPPDGLLQPGDMVSAHVSIQDPGSGAQGFELELCLPRRGTGLECTGQPFK